MHLGKYAVVVGNDIENLVNDPFLYIKNIVGGHMPCIGFSPHNLTIIRGKELNIQPYHFIDKTHTANKDIFYLQCFSHFLQLTGSSVEPMCRIIRNDGDVLKPGQVYA